MEGKRTSTPNRNVTEENQPQCSRINTGSSSFGDLSTITSTNSNFNYSRNDALRMRKEANISVKNQEDMLRLCAELAICNVEEKPKNTEDIDVDAQIEKLEKEIKSKEILLEKASAVEKLFPLINKAEEYNNFLDETKKKLINGSSLRTIKHQKCNTEQDINLENVEKNLKIIQNNLQLYKAENSEVADTMENTNKLINQNLSALKDFKKWAIHHKATSIIYG